MNTDHTSLLRDAAVAGSLASLASTAVLAARGRRETGRASAPINAISHWVHGPAAYTRNEPDRRHTGLGLAIHHASSLLWGLAYVALLRRAAATRRPRLDRPWKAAALTTLVAAVTDFKLVPPRLTPGFEHRLSRGSVASTYLAFGVGLALSGLWLQARRRRRP
jgi:hypothetical protein